MELDQKYLVIKMSDYDDALAEEQKDQLARIFHDIVQWRTKNKKKINRYVVINQDEPYFSDVLKLMGFAEDENR